ncbi:hypothetical protein LNV08_20970 [Paucibacter sp. TC2R-5]|uniref:hypothetical protein n=1 Tax=Paucibacter sp. TC2R-5 TaxID=2893555 RepID=UPI0021E3F7A6|nr:hypothetical protein [Paucibacter sp. TC2R-5]MCV2361441.1 hypothetical protein [Paucibacter sp. TC2R-5]
MSSNRYSSQSPELSSVSIELRSARFVLAEGDAFHDLTPDEQDAAVLEFVMVSRATLSASPELQAWVNAGKH